MKYIVKSFLSLYGYIINKKKVNHGLYKSS